MRKNDDLGIFADIPDSKPTVAADADLGIFADIPSTRKVQSTTSHPGVVAMAERLNVDPEHLWRVIRFESGGRTDARNKKSGASGLIQFMPFHFTQKDDGSRNTDKKGRPQGWIEGSPSAFRRKSFEEQLPYVERYLRQQGASGKKFEDLYASVLFPAAVGKPSNHPLFKRGSKEYRQNEGLDLNRDGTVTKEEAATSAWAKGSPSRGKDDETGPTAVPEPKLRLGADQRLSGASVLNVLLKSQPPKGQQESQVVKRIKAKRNLERLKREDPFDFGRQDPNDDNWRIAKDYEKKVGGVLKGLNPLRDVPFVGAPGNYVADLAADMIAGPAKSIGAMTLPPGHPDDLEANVQLVAGPITGLAGAMLKPIGKAVARGAVKSVVREAAERTALGPVAGAVRNIGAGAAMREAAESGVSGGARVASRATTGAAARGAVEANPLRSEPYRPKITNADGLVEAMRRRPERPPAPRVEPELDYDASKGVFSMPVPGSIKPAERMTATEYVESKWRNVLRSEVTEARAIADSVSKAERRRLGFGIRQAEQALKDGTPPQDLVDALTREHAQIVAQRTPAAPPKPKRTARAPREPKATPAAQTTEVTPAVAEPAPAVPLRVRVADAEFDLYGEARAAYEAAEKAYQDRLGRITSDASNDAKGRAWAATQKKAAGIEFSAAKRRIVGAQTEKEAKAAATQANKVVPGTRVVLGDGAEGVAQSNSYGKVRVELPDGTTRLVDRAEVRPVSVTDTGPLSGAVKVGARSALVAEAAPVAAPAPAPVTPVAVPAARIIPPPNPTSPVAPPAPVSAGETIPGIRMADLEAIAQQKGYALPSRETLRRTRLETQAEAMRNRADIEAEVKGATLDPNPSLTAEEHFIGQIQLRELNGKVDALAAEMTKVGEGAKEGLQIQMEDLLRQGEALSRTLYTSNSNKGRELAFLRSQVPDSFDDAALLVKAERLSGGNLTNKSRQRIIVKAREGQRARKTLEEKMKSDAEKALERLRKMGVEGVNVADLEKCK